MKVFGEHFVTCGQMKILEKRADERGLSYYQMMENAGRRAAEIIMETVSYRRALKEERKHITEAVPDAFAVKGGRKAGHEEAPLRVAESGAVSAGNSNRKASEGERDGAENRAASYDSGGALDMKSYKEKDETFIAPLKALVFCGKGNNGGDGFVVARILKNAGWDVDVVLVDGDPRTDESIKNFEILKSLNAKVIDMRVDGRALMDVNMVHDVIVDAIYGTGFRGAIENNGLKSAVYINSKHERTIVFALDIPSGLGGDLMEADGVDSNTVRADYTIAFHAKKPVHLQKFAENYCGKVIVADIGIDEESLLDVDKLVD